MLHLMTACLCIMAHSHPWPQLGPSFAFHLIRLQRQALCNHLPGLQALLEAMPAGKPRTQQVRL